MPRKFLVRDLDLIEFPLNLEYLEAEFFLFGDLGYGLDKVSPELPSQGPSPMGDMKYNLSFFVHDIILEFTF